LRNFSGAVEREIPTAHDFEWEISDLRENWIVALLPDILPHVAGQLPDVQSHLGCAALQLGGRKPLM
jgi:hypothetical protein